MSKIFLITSSREDWQGSTCFTNWKAYTTLEAAEKCIKDFYESIQMYSRQ